MPLRRTILIALLLTQASCAWAEALEKDRVTLVREAFASPYGLALTAEFGKSLRASADPTCLAGKGLSANQLEPHGRDVIIKWGTRMMESAGAPIDRQNATNPFRDAAELDRLKRNAVVQRYLAIDEPMRQARILDLIFEHFDRYVLISRIRLGAVSPLATGNSDLLGRNPSGATEEALEKFVAKNKSSSLRRFLQLSEQAELVQQAAVKTVTPPPPLPHTFLRGVENDLAELCIRSGK